MVNPEDLEAARERIRDQVASEALRITMHAHEEMVDEDIRLDDVLGALRSGEILESYPENRRGACCLLGGYTSRGRPLHVVCTTARPVLIVITVYEPLPPKWESPTKRGPRP